MVHLCAGDVGDAAQVIGRLQPPLGGALLPSPAAVEPVIGHPTHAAGLEPGEAAAELAVAVEGVTGPIRALLLVRRGRTRSRRAGSRGEHVDVGAELYQEVGPGLAGELGVPRGVVPARRGSRRRGSD